MKIIFQAEIDIEDVNPNYFCADQTNMNQELTSRNFYDSAKINLYLPNSDLVIGSCLYSSVNSQDSRDFSVIFQNIWSVFAVDYNDIVGTFTVNYVVINSEYIKSPIISTISSASGAFTLNINENVYINRSETNPTRILVIIYTL